MARDPRRKGRPKRPVDVFKEAVEQQVRQKPETPGFLWFKQKLLELQSAYSASGLPCMSKGCGRPSFYAGMLTLDRDDMLRLTEGEIDIGENYAPFPFGVCDEHGKQGFPEIERLIFSFVCPDGPKGPWTITNYGKF